MTFLRAFLLAIVVGAAAVLLMTAMTRSPSSMSPRSSDAAPLTEGIAVTDQIHVAGVAGIAARGFRTLIDLRPDGEEPGQPSSAAIGEAARGQRMMFHYIPTPQGDVPDAVVERLAGAIAASERPVMLYCRSGKRAARVWALAEASRIDGAAPAAIASAVRAAGQPVDDILPRIEARAAARKVSN